MTIKNREIAEITAPDGDVFTAFWSIETGRIFYFRRSTMAIEIPENGDDSNPVATYEEAAELIGQLYAGPDWMIDWAW